MSEDLERGNELRDLQDDGTIFRLLVESLPHGVLVIEQAGLQFANQAFANLVGWAPLDLVGVPLADLIAPEDRARVLAYYAHRQAGEASEGECECHLLHRDTGRRLPVSMALVFRPYQGQRVAIATFSDMRERRELERHFRESLDRRGRQVQLGTELAQEIAATPALDELYRRVVTLVRERFGYSHVQIFRHDPESNTMMVVEGYGEAGAKMKAARHHLPYGRGVVGTAAATGQPVLASDVSQDSSWVPNPHLPGTRGELAVPIKLRGEVLGVLDVQSDVAGALGEEDQVLLLGLAGQIAAAIQSTRLVEQTKAALAETEALYRLSSSIISFEDLPSLLQIVVDNVAELLPANRVSLISFDLEKHAVTNFVGGGPGFADVVTGVGFDELWDGLSGWVLRELKPALSPKEQPDPRESPAVQQRRRETNCGSIIVVPLLYRDRLLGTMTAINCPDEEDFSQEDVDLMMAMANQAAAAIENHRLFDQIQAALAEEQEAEQFLGTLMDSIPNPIFFKDTKGVYIGCNQAFLDYLGTTREQILGKSVYDLSTSKDLADQYHAMDMELFRSSGVQVYESRVKYADGTFHNVIFNKASFHNPDGSLGGLIGTIVDISERKQAEAEQERLLASVRQSERLMRTLIDALPNYIYVKDAQGRNLLVNTAMARVYGLASPEEAIGKSDFDFYPRELAEQYHASEQAVLVEGKPLIGHEEPAEELAGKSKWHSSTKVPLRDEQGAIIGLVGITTDITEQKQVEIERERLLNESEALYQASRQINAALDAEGVLAAVQEYVRTLDLDRCLIALLEKPHASPAERRVEVVAVWDRQGKESAFLGNSFTPAQIPFVGTLGPSDRLVVSDFATADQVDERTRATFRYLGVGAAAILPLAVGNWLLGWLLAETVNRPRDFDDHEIEQLESIAGQAAIALQNLRLLEETRSRALQLQTAAEVSRATSEILDVDELLSMSVNLIRERFGLYYAGLFLVDEVPGEPGGWAVLRAGTGEAGRQMLAHEHKLAVGGESMIGWCTANAQARIAQYVGEDAVRLANPLLPDTRSEMALPLVARGQVIGAMTIHSEREAAFSEEDISVLQTMASQVANAIANARLFEQAQDALREMEATHRRYLRQAWTDYLETVGVSTYETGRPDSARLGDAVLPEIQQAVQRREATVLTGNGGEQEGASALVVPVALRGEIIGALGIHDEAGTRQWTDEEIALVEAVAERMAITAESLRLLDETQRRAARERLTGAVTTRMREALDVDAVLKTAAQEMRQALGLSKLTVRLAGRPSAPGGNVEEAE